MKTEFPPLYSAGFHDISFEEISKIFLDPFENKTRRKLLIERLSAFMKMFKRIGINAEIWLDGSFSTRKEEPEDIDVLFLFDEGDIENLPIPQNAILNQLFDLRVCKMRYQIDLIVVSSSNTEEIEYYKNLFGFGWNKNEKGIPRIKYEVNI